MGTSLWLLPAHLDGVKVRLEERVHSCLPLVGRSVRAVRCDGVANWISWFASRLCSVNRPHKHVAHIMFSHITMGTRSLILAAEFYDALLIPLANEALPRFYVYMPFNREPASIGNGSMVAFLAPTRDAVDVSFRAGIKAGGSDEGHPGERSNCGAGYYGAYLRDPDGNKVHVVYRGDLGDAITRAA